MQSKHTGLAAIVMITGAALVGCHSSSSGPTTMSVPETNMQSAGPTTMPVPSANQTEVALPSTTPPAAKDLTHVLTKDEPLFINEPDSSSSKPVTTLKEGTKMLVVIPGATYSQVITDRGITGYTMTDGLKPLGK